jgi:hypothetical protein
MPRERRTSATNQLTGNEADAARSPVFQGGDDRQSSGGVFVGAVNGVEALAVGALHVVRDVLVTAIAVTTDLTVQVVSMVTGVARGAVRAAAGLGGEVVGLETARVKAATGADTPARTRRARTRHDKAALNSAGSVMVKGHRGKPSRRSRPARPVPGRRGRTATQKPTAA